MDATYVQAYTHHQELYRALNMQFSHLLGKILDCRELSSLLPTLGLAGADLGVEK